jgi:hypothetical protein
MQLRPPQFGGLIYFKYSLAVPKTRTSGEVCCRATELYLPLYSS